MVRSPQTAAHEEVMPSESVGVSTSSMPSTSGASIHSALKEVSFLKRISPVKKSDCGRKSMQNTILKLPESVDLLRQKAETKRLKQAKEQEKRKQKTAEMPPKKRCRRALSTSAAMILSSSDSEEDFCIICKGAMPKKLTRDNSIHCNVCDRAVHLKCANLQTGYYTCESD